MPSRAAVACRAAALLSVLVVTGSGVTSCSRVGGSDSDRTPAGGPSSDDHPTSSGSGPQLTPPTAPPTRSPTTSHGAGGSTPPLGGVVLGESLTLGSLRVRAQQYQRAGFSGGATGTRVDVVTVEECAEDGSTLVQHRGWRLLDASGRTLGRAGGKIVNGNPTEDLPQTLAAGQCATTSLVIGVPAGSTPVAVQDGPADTWLLTD